MGTLGASMAFEWSRVCDSTGVRFDVVSISLMTGPRNRRRVEKYKTSIPKNTHRDISKLYAISICINPIQFCKKHFWSGKQKSEWLQPRPGFILKMGSNEILFILENRTVKNVFFSLVDVNKKWFNGRDYIL